MICGNCGKQIPENSRFCPVCGAQVVNSAPAEANYSPAPQQASVNVPPYAAQPEFYSPGYAAPVKTKKPMKKWVKALIIAGSVIAVLGILFAVFSSYIIDFFKRAFNSDEGYMQLKTVELAEKFTDAGAIAFDVYEDFVNGSIGKEARIKVEAGSLAQTLLKQNGVNLSSAEIRLKVISDFPDVKFAVSLNANGEDVLSGTAVLKDEKLYLSVPELVSDVAVIDVGSIGFDAEEFEKLKTVLPDGDLARKIFGKYLGLFAECIEDADSESDEISVDGVTCSATVFTTKINEATLKRALKKLIEEAKDDEDIIELIKQFAEASGQMIMRADISEEYGKAIDEILKDWDNLTILGDKTIVYKMWVNRKGDVLGIEADLGEGEAAGFKLAKDSGDFAFSVYMRDEGTTQEFIRAKGTYSGDEYTGKLTVIGTEYKEEASASAYEYDENAFVAPVKEIRTFDAFTIEFEDFDMDSICDGYLNGKLTIPLPESAGALGNVSVKLAFESSSSRYNVVITPLFGGTELGTLEFEMSDVSEGVDVPSGSQKSVNEERGLQEWLKGFDLNKLMELAKKLGIYDLISSLQSSTKVPDEVPYIITPVIP